MTVVVVFESFGRLSCDSDDDDDDDNVRMDGKAGTVPRGMASGLS